MSFFEFDVSTMRLDGEGRRLLNSAVRDNAELLDDGAEESEQVNWTSANYVKVRVDSVARARRRRGAK